MIHSIENDYLKISVDDHVLSSAVSMTRYINREVLWQADPASGIATHRSFPKCGTFL